MSDTDTTQRQLIDHALHAATRAPSLHNTQPWRFVVVPPRVELYLDRDRVLPVADPEAREALLSCGAALLNLTVALGAADRAVVTDLLPDPDRPDLLATIRVGGYRLPSPELRSLAAAIDRRATHRLSFDERPVPVPLRQELAHAASADGARLVMLDTPRLVDAFTTLLRRADHLQEEDPAFQAELLEWTDVAPGRTDGVPRAAGGPRPIGGELFTLHRFHDTTTPGEQPDEQGPLLAVLTTPGDTVLDRLRAGQALQRVLLGATTAGLNVSFLSPPVEIPYIRAAVRTLLGGRHHPQSVLRIGYGHPAAPTPRRPVAEVASLPTPDEETS